MGGADGGQSHAYGAGLSTIGGTLGNPVRYMHWIGRKDRIAIFSGELFPLLPLSPVIGAGGWSERLVQGLSNSTPGIFRDSCRQSLAVLGVMGDGLQQFSKNT